MAKFIYLNVSPENEHKNDCVTRAITLATGLKYSRVRKMLFHSAKLMQCAKLECSCYSHLLNDTFKFTRVQCRGMTVGEFADLHPYGTFILRVPNHATVVIDGNCYDTFWCLDYECDLAWQVN